jgi:hypothetical protein
VQDALFGPAPLVALAVQPVAASPGRSLHPAPVDRRGASRAGSARRVPGSTGDCAASLPAAHEPAREVGPREGCAVLLAVIEAPQRRGRAYATGQPVSQPAWHFARHAGPARRTRGSPRRRPSPALLLRRARPSRIRASGSGRRRSVR